MKRDVTASRLPKETPFQAPELHKEKSAQKLDQDIQAIIRYIQDRASHHEAKEAFIKLEQFFQDENRAHYKKRCVEAFTDLATSPSVLKKHPGVARRSINLLTKGLENTFYDYQEEILYATHLNMIINNKDIAEHYPHFAEQSMVSLTDYALTEIVMNKEGILNGVQTALRNKTLANHFMKS